MSWVWELISFVSGCWGGNSEIQGAAPISPQIPPSAFDDFELFFQHKNCKNFHFGNRNEKQAPRIIPGKFPEPDSARSRNLQEIFGVGVWVWFWGLSKIWEGWMRFTSQNWEIIPDYGITEAQGVHTLTFTKLSTNSDFKKSNFQMLKCWSRKKLWTRSRAGNNQNQLQLQRNEPKIPTTCWNNVICHFRAEKGNPESPFLFKNPFLQLTSSCCTL